MNYTTPLFSYKSALNIFSKKYAVASVRRIAVLAQRLTAERQFGIKRGENNSCLTMRRAFDGHNNIIYMKEEDRWL